MPGRFDRVRRALADEEHAQAEHRARAFLQPYVTAARSARRGG
ncbi:MULTISPECIES: hypothetical protein [unclassified Streptomyces]